MTHFTCGWPNSPQVSDAVRQIETFLPLGLTYLLTIDLQSYQAQMDLFQLTLLSLVPFTIGLTIAPFDQLVTRLVTRSISDTIN